MASNTPTPDTTGLAANSIAIANNTNPPVTSMGSNTEIGANGIRIMEHILSDAFWPSNLTLDLEKSNWQEWCQHTKLLALK
jgi:hypothetical protein